jgi:Restriction endonuclease
VRKSVEFEQLVAKIVSELHPTSTVTWDDHIMGRLSGRRRQIDVSIRRENPDFLGIIDAKDYARPATIERLDALSGVMRDVGANYGALVCSSGFTPSIYDYARNCGISLFNAHDAQSMNWSLELQIPILWTELKPVVRFSIQAHFEAGDFIPTTDPRGLLVTTNGGESFIDPIATFQELWNACKLNMTPGVQHHLIADKPVQAFVLDDSGERQLRPMTNYGLVYTVEQKSWLGKFQPDECRGLLDYLSGPAFIASHLPDEAVPMQRDERWELVDDPAKLALTMAGTIMFASDPVVVSNGRVDDLALQYIGP